ncbi:MAG: YigZ family protein [Clostridia bacterium]|nr:YigZ family protein [Clostridia bacterium]
MQSYITIKQHGQFKYEDRKSVFIGEAMPVTTEAEALAFIESVKKKYPDARHHVYAYVLRENSIMRFTDDREPQGSAGMPTLDAIRKRGCTDTAVVVTRYFGGTLLGTGGLVRAYTAAAQGAIEEAMVIKYDIYTELSILLSYSDYGKITQLTESSGFRTDDTVFADNVTLLGRLPKANFEGLEKNIADITSNRAKITVLSEKFDF